MNAGHRLRPGDPRTALAGLGVNVGRVQREDNPAILVEASVCRVLIDVHPDGTFTIYADADVQVLCRCAHVPEDQLVQVHTRPTPEAWLDEPIGHGGDGSVADLLAEVAADWPDLR